MRSIAAAALAVASLSLAEEPRPLPAERDVWRATDVPGFVVYGNVAERTLYDIADGLAKLKAVLSRTAGGLDMDGERSIPVYVFRNTAEFRPYAPGTRRLGGYFATAFGYRAIALDLSASGGNETVYHELVHHVVRRNFGDVPLWFNEGIATLYETFRCTDGKATVGWVPRSRLVWLNMQPLMPVTRLAAVTTEDDDYNESDRVGTFYLQSWLLVHDLLFGHPARGAQLAAYLKKVHEGMPPEEALESAFDGGSAALDAELAAYLKTGYFPFTDIAFDDLRVPAPSRARVVERREVLGALGTLALVGNPREPGFARAHFEAALAIAPDDPRARSGLAATAAAEGKHQEAATRIDAVVAAGAGDPALLVLGARAILRIENDANDPGADEGQPASPAIVKARTWLEKAIRADPFNDEALAVYGMSFLASGGDVMRGIAALERADTIDRLDDSMLYNLLELHVRNRDRKKAEALFATRIQATGEPGIVARSAEALLRLDLEDARAAVEAEDYGRALALMKGIRDRTTDDERRARAAEMVVQLEAAASRKKPAAAPKSKR